VPDRIFQVRSIPYTLTGKKMESAGPANPDGGPVEKAANRAAMANVEALDFFIEYASTQSDYRLTT
jgi:acetoacetyl-CoA synthetase